MVVGDLRQRMVRPTVPIDELAPVLVLCWVVAAGDAVDQGAFISGRDHGIAAGLDDRPVLTDSCRQVFAHDRIVHCRCATAVLCSGGQHIVAAIYRVRYIGLVSDEGDQSWHIELSEEVDEWLEALPIKAKAQAVRALDQLAAHGNSLRMPHSRKLGDQLWELRFRCERVNQRITYTVEPERRVITLTTFRKQRDNERKEVARARNVLRRRQAKG